MRPQLNPWLIRPKSAPKAKLRLFCFPYAGGNASTFHSWAHKLPDEIEVCGVQLPGRGERIRQQAYTHISTLLPALIEGIQPSLDKPFVFFGHSMGALLSFELSRRLRELGAPLPLQMFLSGRAAPQLPDPEPPKHLLPEDEFISELSRLNGTPRQILEHRDLMQLVIPLLRADFAVCETYVYVDQPPFDCPFSVMGGVQDTQVTRDRLEAWRKQTTGPFSLRMFPGDHFFLTTSERLVLESLYRDVYQLLQKLP